MTTMNTLNIPLICKQIRSLLQQLEAIALDISVIPPVGLNIVHAFIPYLFNGKPHSKVLYDLVFEDPRKIQLQWTSYPEEVVTPQETHTDILHNIGILLCHIGRYSQLPKGIHFSCNINGEGCLISHMHGLDLQWVTVEY